MKNIIDNLFAVRVPKRKCRKCQRYTGRCNLSDLEPCSFVRKPSEQKVENIVAVVVVICGCLGSCLTLFQS